MSIQEQPFSVASAHHPGAKQVSVQERSLVVGNFVVINGYRVNLASLKKRFTEGGYLVHETPHFLLFLREAAPSVIVVHWFAPDKMDADVKHYIARELKPYGIISQAQHYGEILGGIVGSLFPDDVRRAWRTLTARRERLSCMARATRNGVSRLAAMRSVPCCFTLTAIVPTVIG